MPEARIRDVITALAGDLALVPWSRPWAVAAERACGDWRNALGPGPLEELQGIVLRASWQEHEDRDWRAVIIGRSRPLLADGSYLAELSGDGVTVTVRVIEYFADVEGQEVPEMFCLVTDLLDFAEYPAPGAGRRCPSSRPRPMIRQLGRTRETDLDARYSFASPLLGR